MVNTQINSNNILQVSSKFNWIYKDLDRVQMIMVNKEYKFT